ncbi:MAG: hypothetical protein SGI86_02980 [Deltaproteobacteria bacterium]|nr:hypothetical protein [Deltaproteobacteria bacterium]
MKLQNAFLKVSFAPLASIIAACSPPGAVQDPTWADDVYPIVQGQCLHCHGGSAEKDGESYRLDMIDFAVCDDLGIGLDSYATLMLPVLEFDDVVKGPLMPPAPARPLEAWQLETIRNWKAAKSPLGKPTNNHSPTLTVETKVSGSKLTLSYLASDPDGDPVLGEIKVGDNLWHRFSSAGSGRVTFDLANESGKLQVTARLCDGWKIVSLDDSDGLKTVDAK